MKNTAVGAAVFSVNDVNINENEFPELISAAWQNALLAACRLPLSLQTNSL